MFVFPMAGASQRFTAAGYSVPKFMLPAGDLNLFQHSIIGFRDFFSSHQFLFIYLKGYCSDAFIAESCKAVGLERRNFEVVMLDQATDGQASTVVQGLYRAGISRDQSLTVFNIDTVYKNFTRPSFCRDEAVSGYVDVVRRGGEHWSFVRPGNEPGVAVEITEKVRVSDLCCTGLYHFNRAADFFDAFESVRLLPLTSLQGQERYVAPLYNILIKSGKQIRYRLLEDDQVQFSGTPQEYDTFLSENGWDTA